MVSRRAVERVGSTRGMTIVGSPTNARAKRSSQRA